MYDSCYGHILEYRHAEIAWNKKCGSLSTYLAHKNLEKIEQNFKVLTIVHIDECKNIQTFTITTPWWCLYGGML